MNNPQLWGALRGLVIAIGGGLISAGAIKLTPEQLGQIVDHSTAVILAVSGLAAVVVPMWRGWRSRSTPAMVAALAADPKVVEVVAAPEVAKRVKSRKVVSAAKG